MPELPEVETYRRDLAAVLPGRTLVGAAVHWPNQLPLNDPRRLSARVAGQVVADVGRHGKILVVDLSRDVMLIHLKMSGRLKIVPATAPADPHAHVVLGLDGGDELRFVDARKFGRVWVVADAQRVLGQLGPDALDAALSASAFAARMARRRGRLKPLLLNQAFVAGVGNIYADEALWAARLHPLRSAADLAAAQVDGLYTALRTVLSDAVAARGTTFSPAGYRDLMGERGAMAPRLRVFRRTGEGCPRCGTPIARIVVAARGTHLCPACQQL